jgi:hypothetical protein
MNSFTNEIHIDEMMSADETTRRDYDAWLYCKEDHATFFEIVKDVFDRDGNLTETETVSTYRDEEEANEFADDLNAMIGDICHVYRVVRS